MFFSTGSTVWLCFPPRTTVAVIYPTGLLVVVFYAILNHGPLKKYQIQEHHRDTSQYKPITTDMKDTKSKHSSCVSYFNFFLDVFPFLAYLFLNFLSFYLSTNSVLTTLTFPSASFRVRDHYQYYKFSGDVGTVLGGLELMLVSCLCPGWLTFFRIRRIWILVLINVSHLLFFLFASWYHFVPNVYIVLVLSATHGVLFGSIAVRTLAVCASSFTDSHDRGTAMSIVEIGSSIGRLVSGLVGIYVEDHLREHCTNNLLLGKYCLARFPSKNGWRQNMQCH